YDDAELTVLLYEFKADVNRYLAEFAPGARVRTLQDVIEFNERNKEREMPYFGQELFLKAQDKGSLSDQAYRDALDKCRKLGREGTLVRLAYAYEQATTLRRPPRFLPTMTVSTSG